MVNKGSHPQMALIQVSEILSFTQIYVILFTYIFTYTVRAVYLYSLTIQGFMGTIRLIRRTLGYKWYQTNGI